jgi:hypothetical protein
VKQLVIQEPLVLKVLKVLKVQLELLVLLELLVPMVEQTMDGEVIFWGLKLHPLIAV